MLVLARKINESIIIGDDIEVVVLEVQGEQVKLGINAPKSIKIYRKEIYEEIQQQNVAAATTSPEQLKDISKLFKANKDSSEKKE